MTTPEGFNPSREAVIGIRECAARLGISYPTALRYAKGGFIPGVIRRGGRWVVPLEALEHFEREGNPKATRLPRVVVIKSIE